MYAADVTLQNLYHKYFNSMFESQKYPIRHTYYYSRPTTIDIRPVKFVILSLIPPFFLQKKLKIFTVEAFIGI